MFNYLVKKSVLLASVSLVVLLSGCAPAAPSETVAGGDSTAYPLTIQNYSIPDGGGMWTEKNQTFTESPQRVVANTQGAAELLIHLGLTDRIVGVAALYGDPDPTIAAEFATIPVLSPDYVGKELVVGANPDLVIGRADLFANADWGVGAVDDLNNLNINTFILTAAKSDATLDNVYKDIEALGKVFNVQDKAAEFIASLQTREAALETALAGESATKTYAYVTPLDEATVSVYSASTDAYLSDALSKIKLTNAFEGVTGEISLETLVATNPDIILTTYYAGGPSKEEIQSNLYNHPALQSLTAIKNKQVYVIDHNEFWSYSYRIFDGVERLGKEIYPNRFTN